MRKLPIQIPSLKQILKYIYVLTLPTHSLPRLKLNFLPRLVVPLIGISAFGFLLAYQYIFKDLPSVTNLSTQPISLSTHIKDRNGVELYKVYSSQNRTLVSLNNVPPNLIHAIIAIEDKDFFKHKGFSATGIARAAIVNAKLFSTTCRFSFSNCEFTPTQGGSTITQQLVKASLLSPERTMRRKVREFLLSLAVEATYSKEKILEMYINRVGFGGATYGIEEAAQMYFGKQAKDLDLAESALLAGLPAAPTAYSPYGAHPEYTKERQQEVLKRMVEEGYISWDDAQKASAKTLTFKPPTGNLLAPHFVMYVKDVLAQKYGDYLVEHGGLEVITSLDMSVQTQAEKVVSTEIAKVNYLHITNGAALITNPSTGEILGMVGSKNYFDTQNDGNVNVVLANRQPGSSIKPLNYALGFSRGLTPATLIDDSPTVYKIAGQPDYSPINYDHKFHGRVTARTALGSSYNIPAVKVLHDNGLQNFIDFAKTLGITTWTDPNRYGLSLTLGGGEVKMLDLATAYGVFANSGQKIPLISILEVRDSKGHVLEKYAPSPEPVLDPSIAFLINDILSDNVARTPTFGPNSQLNINKYQVAVKTGTTNSLRDNWTIGYTPNLLVAVWVGNNDNSPMSYVASGVTGASPIWRKIMDQLLPTVPALSFSKPDTVQRLTVCPNSDHPRSDYFLTGTTNNITCPSKLTDEKHPQTNFQPTPPFRKYEVYRRTTNNRLGDL